MSGGANNQSLWEWQQEVLPTLTTVAESEPDLQRCSDWRPLEAKDCQDNDKTPESGVQYFESAGDSPPYYWRRT